jgi:cysteine synthase A
MRDAVHALVAEGNTFWTEQFQNTDAIRGYMGIGRELVEQAGGNIDAFCGAVGTAGMLSGVSRALKAAGCAARIVALEPASAPLLTAEHAVREAEGAPSASRGGGHRVEGIAPGFVPPHLTRDVYDEARAIDEAEARAMARRLAKQAGVFAGTSSALNVLAALRLARELGPDKTVATVAVDSGLKYLSGDLYAH